jgi:hypothetical protein
MNLAPIALFVYKRPVHTRKTVEALQKNPLASQSRLYIFSDGAKGQDTVNAVAEVRQYIRGIAGFLSIEIIERERNMGLDPSVIVGVTQICNEHGRVIVLEDDLVTAPYFLEYMNDALDRYGNEGQVMQISGYFFSSQIENDKDTFFLPFTTSWGWATWQRAWNYFDLEMTGYKRVKTDPLLRKQFDLDDSYPYLEMLEGEERIKPWDIRWYLSVFTRSGLVLYPGQTLVNNIGYDATATHTKSSLYREAPLFQNRIERYPDQITVDIESFKKVQDFLRSLRSRRIMLRVRRLAKAIWHFGSD